MTGREKIEAAFSAQGTPEIPAVICYEGIYIRDHWSQLTSAPWWYAQSPDISQQLAWHRDAITATGQDWFAIPTSYSRQLRDDMCLEVRPEGVFRVNRKSGREERLEEPQEAGWSRGLEIESVHPEHWAGSASEIDKLLPDVPRFDRESYLSSGGADLAKALLAGPAQDLFPLSHVGTPLWHTYTLWGFEGMMTMVATRPDLVKYACERLLELSLRGVRAAAAVGARGIWLEECLTDMVSPTVFAEINVPLIQRLVGEIRSLGMKSIYYYCGNPHDRWDLLLECGADALALEESKKGWEIDIADVVERVDGKCAILGNLDAIDLLENGSDDDLRKEVNRQIEAGRRNGSRFIMSIGSPVTPGTGVQRVRRYCDLVHELGCR